MNDLIHDDAMDPELVEDEAEEVVNKKKKLHIIGKKIIVLEPYAAPGGIKPTAKKYGIQPYQIRNWQNNANALMDLPAYPIPRTVEERSVIKASKANVTNHKGHASSIPHHIVHHMLQFYEQLVSVAYL
jgi:transposase-like protein